MILELSSEKSAIDQSRILKRPIVRKNTFLRAVLRTSLGSVGVYDMKRRKVLYSEWKIMKRLGYNREDFQSVSRDFFQKIIHPDDRVIISRHLEKIQCAEIGAVLNCTVRLRDYEGTYKLIYIRDAVLQKDKAGRVVRIIASLADVSRLKSLKKQIERNADMLEDLWYRSSHDLRGPVATLLGLVTLLRYEHRTRGNVEEIFDSLESTLVKMDHAVRDFGITLDTDRKQLKKHLYGNSKSDR